MKTGGSSFIAKKCFKKIRKLLRPAIRVAVMEGEKRGGEAEGGSTSVSDLIMKVSPT